MSAAHDLQWENKSPSPPSASISMLAQQPQRLPYDPNSPANQSFNKAIELIKTGDQANAYPLLVSVVSTDPTHAAAWWHMSTILFQSRNYTAAHRAMEKVNSLYPDEPRVLTNLGWYAHVDESTERAYEYLQQAVKLGPDLALAWTNLSQVQIAMGDVKSALRSAQRGLDLCADGNPVHGMSLAFAYLFNGDLPNGLKYYESRFRYKLPQFLTYAFPQWKGEKVGTLFLRAEQGIGDTISTLRFLPECARRCDKVLCYVNSELRTLVEDMAIPNVEVFALPAILPSSADAWLPMMSLPLVLGATMDNLPPTPFVPVYPADKPQGYDGKMIGLVWAGNADNDLDRWRSILLKDMFPLFSVPNTKFFSLQMGKPREQIVSDGAYGFLEDLGPAITDIRDTARIMASLDLVITCCTSTAHLSAAMGKPTWIIRNRRASDWRWSLGSRQGVPWYGDHVSVFERDYSEDWKAVIGRVRIELSGKGR